MKILKSLLLALMMLSTGGLYAQDDRTWSLQVGISDPHYFAKLFKQQFGISPKKYQQGGSR
jgi:AraC-like DNA-binding protein